jgi:hypothetical protein
VRGSIAGVRLFTASTATLAAAASELAVFHAACHACRGVRVCVAVVIDVTC